MTEKRKPYCNVARLLSAASKRSAEPLGLPKERVYTLTAVTAAIHRRGGGTLQSPCRRKVPDGTAFLPNMRAFLT